jgi:hypothetical protein
MTLFANKWEENVLMLDVNCWFLKSGPDDVRWEKVETIKRIVTGGTYAVPAKRVAAKLLRHMLERDRAGHRWDHSRSTSEAKADEESDA